MSSSADLGRPLPTPELRTGTWTRFGGSGVLGDAVTEQTLDALAESTRVAARSQGYATGWAEGRRAARAEALAEEQRVRAERIRIDAERAAAHETAMTALTTAAAQLGGQVSATIARIEEQATELAWQLARQIVGSALPTLDPAARALELAPEGQLARVWLHPAAASAISEESRAALTDRGAVLATDPALGPADALVEIDDHVIDLRIDTALERIQEALR